MEQFDLATTGLSKYLIELESVVAETGRFLSRYGIERRQNISAANRDVFLSWPEEKLARTVRNARKILKAHIDSERDEFDLDDSSRLLAVALSELGFSIDPKFYAMIDRNDILEVYDNDHIQVFRSFNFFRICNYSLDDILAYEWFELYERNLSVTEEIMGKVKDHLLSKATISNFQMSEHVMRERFAEPSGVFLTRPKYLASVYSGPERKPGFVCTLSARIVGSEVKQLSFLGSK